jgi:hypothetical protein
VVVQDGQRRFALQPWIEQPSVAAGGSPAGHAAGEPPAATDDPLGGFLRQLHAALGDLFLLGVQRADDLLTRHWRELQRQGEAVGFGRIAERVAALAELFEQRRRTLQWDSQSAARRVLELAVLARMVQDLAAGEAGER